MKIRRQAWQCLGFALEIWALEILQVRQHKCSFSRPRPARQQKNSVLLLTKFSGIPKENFIFSLHFLDMYSVLRLY